MLDYWQDVKQGAGLPSHEGSGLKFIRFSLGFACAVSPLA